MTDDASGAGANPKNDGTDKEAAKLREVFRRNVERLMKDAALLLLHKRYAGCVVSSILAMEQATEYLHQLIGLRSPEMVASFEASFRNEHRRRFLQGLLLSSATLNAASVASSEEMKEEYLAAEAMANVIQRHKEIATYVDRDEGDAAGWSEPEVIVTGPMAQQFFNAGRLAMRAFAKEDFDRSMLEAAFRPYNTLGIKTIKELKSKRGPRPKKTPKAKR